MNYFGMWSRYEETCKLFLQGWSFAFPNAAIWYLETIYVLLDLVTFLCHFFHSIALTSKGRAHQLFPLFLAHDYKEYPLFTDEIGDFCIGIAVRVAEL